MTVWMPLLSCMRLKTLQGEHLTGASAFGAAKSTRELLLELVKVARQLVPCQESHVQAAAAVDMPKRKVFCIWRCCMRSVHALPASGPLSKW